MPTVETAYGNLFYAPHPGATPPLVLIHGAASSHLAWSAELRRLPERRVLALDLPAHGRSGGQGADDIKAYAAAVSAFLDALGIEKCIPVGHSMGGAIAQTLTLDYPTRCAGLILMASASQLSVNEKILELALSDPKTVAELINKWSWSPQAPPHLKQADLAALQGANALVLHGDYVACSRFNVTARLQELACPVLMVAGSLDKMIPLALPQAMRGQIPDATLAIMEGAGHWVMLEQASQVAEVVTNWLKEKAL